MPSPLLLSSDPVSADSLSFPTTPTSTTHHHHSTLPLESTLPSSPPSLPLPLDEHYLNSLSKLNKLMNTGVQVTPHKQLNRALSKLLAEKPMLKNSHQQVGMNDLIERLSSLASKHQMHSNLEQPRSKRIRIEAAPDGSASLVISPCNYQPHHLHPTTVAPASLFSSPSSSKSSHNHRRSHSEINQHSPLVSATTPQYGRVIMKKEALINKLGFKAAQRAIRRANGHQRKPYQPAKPSSLPPPSSSSPLSSPHVCRTGSSIRKWLESADEEEEEEEEDEDDEHETSQPLPQALGLMDSLSKLAKESKPSLNSDAQPTDPQSLFWSPVKTKKSGDRSSSHSNNNGHHQELIDRLDRMNALEMGSERARWALVERPTTPPNQRSFFHSDDVVHYRPQRPGGPQDRPDLYGPFSQLAFPSHTIGSEGSLPRMLKPGCNLNQAFLVLAPSPKMQNIPGTADTNDENRSPETAPTCHHRSSQLPSANSCERPATNDYSPCSPLHHDLRKLVDLHHHQQSPGRTDTPHLPRQSLRSTPLLRSPSRSHDSLDLRGLVGMDPNRLPDPPSSPFSEPFLDLIPFSSSSGTDPLDDFLGLF
ncbi:hypothetical protein PCANC_11375 [Puccinia coronata f. sp. avenae]|uniref:Uncharacterized protein n=1 Tax=Puccinia coronata f. sp. avenae TaxID=200324 RepID=A0A2N5SUS9_9BASI|nr:hypothetical protein PCANC_11375 [Puccinia coronata f. sp. avenae]